jgi:putative peptidoglycan lipid II flippase
VFPALSQFFAQNRMDMYRQQLSSTLRTVIYLTVPVSVLMFIMAPQIVNALLKQGQFDAHDAEMTANALRFFCFGITAWCLHPVLMRGFFAAHKTVTPIVLGTVTTVLFVVLIFLLRITGIGYLVLPLAGSISAIFLVVVLTMAVSKMVGTLDYSGLWVTVWKSAVGSIGIAIVGSAVAYTPIAARIANSKSMTIFAVFAAFMIGSWLYYFITKALGMPETAYISRAMNRVQRRGRPTPGA